MNPYLEKKVEDWWRKKEELIANLRRAAVECGCKEEDGQRAVHKPKKQKGTRYARK